MKPIRCNFDTLSSIITGLRPVKSSVPDIKLGIRYDMWNFVTLGLKDVILIP